MSTLIFDTQREQWLDLDKLYPEPESEPLPSLPHSCPTCGAYFNRGEQEALSEHLPLCARYMNRVPVMDESGKTLGVLGDPEPARLARHVKFYGPEGAEPWLAQMSPDDEIVMSATSRRRSRTRIAKRPKSQEFSVRA